FAGFDDLGRTALELLQHEGRRLDPDEAGRLAGLIELDESQSDGGLSSERAARTLLELRRQALPPQSPELQRSLAALADILFSKALKLSRQGQTEAACAPFKEARDLIRRTDLQKGAYSEAKVLELDAAFNSCTPSPAVAARLAFIDLDAKAGMG